MPKTRTNRTSTENVTASHSDRDTRHIQGRECDLVDREFAARVKELLANETRVSFAKNCGFSEGALRKYLKGHKPGQNNLVAIASYRNISVQWLATGIGDKEGIKITPTHPSFDSGKSATYAKGHERYDAELLDRKLINSDQRLAATPDEKINTELILLCLLTCKSVFGEDFSQTLITVQLQYAADFYNQLVGIANSKVPKSPLNEFCKLSPEALADQLRFCVTMKWIRPFPSDPGLQSSSWSW